MLGDDDRGLYLTFLPFLLLSSMRNLRVNEFLSAPLKALLHDMLTVDVEKRIGLSGVAEHPWVTEDGLCPLESLVRVFLRTGHS